MCVAASIERNVPMQAWAGAIIEAQQADFQVDAGYLRDRWMLIRGMARTTDPYTSRQAAERVTMSGSRADHLTRIVKAVQERPGRTSAELAIDSGMERHEAARRTADAAQAGLIVRGAPKTCSVSGRAAVTWLPKRVFLPISNRPQPETPWRPSA
jgi:hypothetical protein